MIFNLIKNIFSAEIIAKFLKLEKKALDIKCSIEHYNTVRLQQTLNNFTPIEIYHTN